MVIKLVLTLLLIISYQQLSHSKIVKRQTACLNDGIVCAQPIDDANTRQFECKENCPRGYLCCEDSCFQHKICKAAAADNLVIVTPPKYIEVCPREKYRCPIPFPRHVYQYLACQDGGCPNGYKCCPDSCFVFRVCKEAVKQLKISSTSVETPQITLPTTVRTISSTPYESTDIVTSSTVTEDLTTSFVTNSNATEISTTVTTEGSGDDEEETTGNTYSTNQSITDEKSETVTFSSTIREENIATQRITEEGTTTFIEGSTNDVDDEDDLMTEIEVSGNKSEETTVSISTLATTSEDIEIIARVTFSSTIREENIATQSITEDETTTVTEGSTNDVDDKDFSDDDEEDATESTKKIASTAAQDDTDFSEAEVTFYRIITQNILPSTLSVGDDKVAKSSTVKNVEAETSTTEATAVEPEGSADNDDNENDYKDKDDDFETTSSEAIEGITSKKNSITDRTKADIFTTMSVISVEMNEITNVTGDQDDEDYGKEDGEDNKDEEENIEKIEKKESEDEQSNTINSENENEKDYYDVNEDENVTEEEKNRGIVITPSKAIEGTTIKNEYVTNETNAENSIVTSVASEEMIDVTNVPDNKDGEDYEEDNQDKEEKESEDNKSSTIVSEDKDNDDEKDYGSGSGSGGGSQELTEEERD